MKFLLLVAILISGSEAFGMDYIEYYYHGDWGVSFTIVINEDNTFISKEIQNKSGAETVSKQGKLADGSFVGLAKLIKDNGIFDLETGDVDKAVGSYQKTRGGKIFVIDAETPKLTYFNQGKKREQEYPGALALKKNLRPLRNLQVSLKLWIISVR